MGLGGWWVVGRNNGNRDDVACLIGSALHGVFAVVLGIGQIECIFEQRRAGGPDELTAPTPSVAYEPLCETSPGLDPLWISWRAPAAPHPKPEQFSGARPAKPARAEFIERKRLCHYYSRTQTDFSWNWSSLSTFVSKKIVEVTKHCYATITAGLKLEPVLPKHFCILRYIEID